MKILDQHGNPFDTGQLAEPQTTRIAQLAHQLIDSQLDGISPAKAARILKDADLGDLTAQSQLFDDMLDRDAHLRSEYEKRQGAPVALDWSIEPPANASAAEKAAAAYAGEMLRDAVDDLEDVLLAMMEAPGHGFAPIELEWQRIGRDWIPKFHPRPQTWFRTDTHRRALRLADGSPDGAEPIPMGWILHQHKKVKTGYLGRAGIFRACLWPFLYKAYAVGDFAEFLETYGLPIIVGKYMAGATAEEKSSLMRAVAALGHDARAIMPEGMALEIQTVTGGTGGSHHMAMVEWADRAQSKVVLGQTTSSEAQATGLGSGVADLHGEVRRDILKSDARQLADTLTRDLIYPLVALNRPGVESYRRCPRWVFDAGEAEDLAAYAEALPKLVGVGFKIPRAWGHAKLRIPEPDANEDVLEVPAMPPMGALRRPAMAAARRPAAEGFADQDMLDAALEAIGADTLDAQMRELLAPVLERLDEDPDPNELLGWLAEAFPEADGGALEEKLGRLLWAAQMWGRLNGRA
ncbi:DUF935 domain-containing protein [Pseudazoarcus pumilus]|uniref:DUF935 domain-containing protein n=1 Tax=Pseudazoarcus pumilus TaxID=2067960 RepID=A0A2I6S9F5_9RHOO|nr:DUF935 domain-containing protein [Pseudazoarcus pumilus]AUN95884.1 hypothetical protein C0099_13655 [Pseudazoarcus pumilus]